MFERRHHAVLVDANEHLLELLRYIHLNPVRAQIVSLTIDYPWSSHHAYLGIRAEPWVTTDFALSMFHSERHHAIEAYRRFIHTAAAKPVSSPWQNLNPSDARILGNDDFAAKLLGATWRPRSRKTLDELIDEACTRFASTRAALLSPNRQRQLTHIRAWIGRQALALRLSLTSRTHLRP